MQLPKQSRNDEERNQSECGAEEEIDKATTVETPT